MPTQKWSFKTEIAKYKMVSTISFQFNMRWFVLQSLFSINMWLPLVKSYFSIRTIRSTTHNP